MNDLKVYSVKNNTYLQPKTNSFYYCIIRTRYKLRHMCWLLCLDSLTFSFVVLSYHFLLQQKNCLSSSSTGSVLNRIMKQPTKIAAVATANHSYWYPSSLRIANIIEHMTEARGTIVIMILTGIEYCLMKQMMS